MLSTILVGFFVGVLARWIKPGAQPIGWLMTILVGIGGAVLATVVGQTLGWYRVGAHAGFLASVAGAVAVLFGFEALRSRRAAPSDEKPRS